MTCSRALQIKMHISYSMYDMYLVIFHLYARIYFLKHPSASKINDSLKALNHYYHHQFSCHSSNFSCSSVEWISIFNFYVGKNNRFSEFSVKILWNSAAVPGNNWKCNGFVTLVTESRRFQDNINMYIISYRLWLQNACCSLTITLIVLHYGYNVIFRLCRKTLYLILIYLCLNPVLLQHSVQYVAWISNCHSKMFFVGAVAALICL